jgi:hypothetical protein
VERWISQPYVGRALPDLLSILYDPKMRIYFSKTSLCRP